MLEATARDFRFAARALRRNPGFTAVAVLTLALGIGATTAVFGVVYGVVLKPLPFPNAERLVQIVQLLQSSAEPEPIRAGLTPNQFVDLREHSTTLEAVGGYAAAPRTLTGLDVPVRLSGAAVTPGLFAGLGVQASLGRTFTPEDGERPVLTDPVVILSHRTWIRYFGGDPGIIDRRIALGDTRPRVIGVMPEGFGFPSLASESMSTDSTGSLDDAPEFWLAMSPYQRSNEAGFSILMAFGILKDNVTQEQALAEIRSHLTPLPTGQRPSLEIVSARHEFVRGISPVLTIFQLGVTLILLIACVNVVNLLLARAAHRRRDVALRFAIGATRSRIVRESVAESFLLALTGGALGCFFAFVIVEVLRTLPPHLLPRLRELRVDGNVLLFALAVSVGTGIAVGLFSALRASRSRNRYTALVLGGVRAAPHHRLRPSGALVVVEIAATMVLLTGAGLLINSYAHLMRVNPGFDPDGAIAFQLSLGNIRYAPPEAQQQVIRRVLDGIRKLPGVQSAAATSLSLEGAPVGFSELTIDGRTVNKPSIRYRFVTSDYFRALGVQMREGRDFVDADTGIAATTAIVNDAFVNRHLNGLSPLATVLRWGDRPSLQIVGVAPDWKLRRDEDAQPTLYLPADARAFFGLSTFIVRSRAGLRQLLPHAREIVRDADPQLALHNAMTIDDMMAHGAASPRLYGLVSFWCALIALVLAGTGLYGVLAYSVGTRTQEFGIRVALGATAGMVTSSVLRQGLQLTAAGLVVGLAGAHYATRFLGSLLFGLRPHDPATFTFAAVMFVVVGLCACYVPCRRATRVDPVVALRAE